MHACKGSVALFVLFALAPSVAFGQAGAGNPAAAVERPALDDPNTTRLFFGPTGRTLERGQGYAGVYQLLLPFVQVGVTDRITVGGGTPLLFIGDGAHPFWVTPKVQVFRGGNAQVAAGVLHFFGIGEGTAGIAYGVGTFGSADSAITVGTGWAYSRFDDQGSNAMVGMIGGEHRVGRRTKLITENYVFDGGGFLSAGFRFFREGLSADIGLVSPVSGGDAVVFPVVNVVLTFPASRK